VFGRCEPGDEIIPFFVEHVGEDARLVAWDDLRAVMARIRVRRRRHR
jgi:hypothetical protein